MTKRAIVLVSGGLDSITCLAIAKEEKYEIHALSFEYGQRHQSELEAAKRSVDFIGVKSHRVVTVPTIGHLGGSALTDAAIAVPDYHASTEIPITYVPARNTIFFSIALGLAEVLNANTIISGVSSVDYSHYPDCRPEYIEALQNLVDLATKTTVEDNPIKIYTPLILLSKAQTIQKGLSLGVDYSLTVSCYRADAKGYACGTCDSCAYRKKGFNEAGIADPTHYY